MDFVEVKYYTTNFWGNKVYNTKDGYPIVKLDEGWYTLSDPRDIDSDPYTRIVRAYIKIVKEFS